MRQFLFLEEFTIAAYLVQELHIFSTCSTLTELQESVRSCWIVQNNLEYLWAEKVCHKALIDTRIATFSLGWWPAILIPLHLLRYLLPHYCSKPVILFMVCSLSSLIVGSSGVSTHTHCPLLSKMGVSCGRQRHVFDVPATV
jgi:hypothetical protein